DQLGLAGVDQVARLPRRRELLFEVAQTAEPEHKAAVAIEEAHGRVCGRHRSATTAAERREAQGHALKAAFFEVTDQGDVEEIGHVFGLFTVTEHVEVSIAAVERMDDVSEGA